MYHLFRSLYLHATSKEEYSILLLGLDNAGKTTLMNQVKTLYKTESGHNPDHNEADPQAGNTVPTVGQNVTTIDLPEMYLKIWDVGGQMGLRRLWTSYYRSAHAVVFVLDSTDLGTMLDVEGQHSSLPNGGEGILSPSSTTGGAGGGTDEGAGLRPGLGAGPRKWHGRRKSSYNMFSDPTADAASSTEKTMITPGLLGRHEGQGRLDEAQAVLESVLGHPDMSGIPVLVLANKQDREDCIEVVRIKEGFVRPVFEGEKGGMVRDSRVLPVSALQGTGVREAVDWIKSRVVWNKEGRAPVMR